MQPCAVLSHIVIPTALHTLRAANAAMAAPELYRMLRD
jgi:hypothetical protein